MLDDRRRIEGLLALVVVQVAFGSFAVFLKLALGTHPGEVGFAPRAVIVWRVVVTAVVFGLLVALRYRRTLLPPRAELPRYVVCALLGVVVNQLFAVEGTARTHAIHAGILFTTIPIFTYLVAVRAGQERLSRRRTVGIVVALLGAALLVVRRGDVESPASAPLLGNVLIVINCASYAVYLVLARKLLARTPSPVVIARIFVLATLAMPLVALGVDVVPADVSPGAVRALAGLVGITTVVAYLLNTYALARVSASTTAAATYLQPVVATLAAIVFLGERPGPWVLVSTAVLFAGIWLVVRSRGRAT